MAGKLIPLIAAGISAAGTVATAAISSSAARRAQPKLQAPLPTATRDDARATADRRDELMRRRGTSADILLGPAAGEATGVTAKQLTGE